MPRISKVRKGRAILNRLAEHSCPEYIQRFRPCDACVLRKWRCLDNNGGKGACYGCSTLLESQECVTSCDEGDAKGRRHNGYPAEYGGYYPSRNEMIAEMERIHEEQNAREDALAEEVRVAVLREREERRAARIRAGPRLYEDPDEAGDGEERGAEVMEKRREGRIYGGPRWAEEDSDEAEEEIEDFEPKAVKAEWDGEVIAFDDSEEEPLEELGELMDEDEEVDELDDDTKPELGLQVKEEDMELEPDEDEAMASESEDDMDPELEQDVEFDPHEGAHSEPEEELQPAPEPTTDPKEANDLYAVEQILQWGTFSTRTTLRLGERTPYRALVASEICRAVQPQLHRWNRLYFGLSSYTPGGWEKLSVILLTPGNGGDWAVALLDSRAAYLIAAPADLTTMDPHPFKLENALKEAIPDRTFRRIPSKGVESLNGRNAGQWATSLAVWLAYYEWDAKRIHSYNFQYVKVIMTEARKQHLLALKGERMRVAYVSCRVPGLAKPKPKPKAKPNAKGQAASAGPNAAARKEIERLAREKAQRIAEQKENERLAGIRKENPKKWKKIQKRKTKEGRKKAQAAARAEMGTSAATAIGVDG